MFTALHHREHYLPSSAAIFHHCYPTCLFGSHTTSILVRTPFDHHRCPKRVQETLPWLYQAEPCLCNSRGLGNYQLLNYIHQLHGDRKTTYNPICLYHRIYIYICVCVCVYTQTIGIVDTFSYAASVGSSPKIEASQEPDTYAVALLAKSLATRPWITGWRLHLESQPAVKLATSQSVPRLVIRRKVDFAWFIMVPHF